MIHPVCLYLSQLGHCAFEWAGCSFSAGCTHVGKASVLGRQVTHCLQVLCAWHVGCSLAGRAGVLCRGLADLLQWVGRVLSFTWAGTGVMGSSAELLCFMGGAPSPGLSCCYSVGSASLGGAAATQLVLLRPSYHSECVHVLAGLLHLHLQLCQLLCADLRLEVLLPGGQGFIHLVPLLPGDPVHPPSVVWLCGSLRHPVVVCREFSVG